MLNLRQSSFASKNADIKYLECICDNEGKIETKQLQSLYFWKPNEGENVISTNGTTHAIGVLHFVFTKRD